MKLKKISRTVARAVVYAGGQHELVKLSQIFGPSITQPSISNAMRNNRCGWKVALALERATHGFVLREELCPESYPPRNYSERNHRGQTRISSPKGQPRNQERESARQG